MAARNPGEPCILAENYLEDYTLASSGDATGFPKENLKNRRTSDKWQSSGIPNPTYIDVNDAGINGKDVTAWALFNHNLSGLVVSLIDDPTGSPITIPGSQVIVPDNMPVVQFFDAHTVGSNRLRFNIASPSVAPFIGVLLICEHFEFPYAVEMPFDSNNLEMISNEKASQNGVLLGRDVVYGRVIYEGGIRHLESSWVVSTLRPFWEAHLADMFAFAWNNLLEPRNVRLVVNDPARLNLIKTQPGLHDYNFSMRGTNGEPIAP